MKKNILFLISLLAFFTSNGMPVYNLVSKVTSEKASPSPASCEVEKYTDGYTLRLSIEEIGLVEDFIYSGRYIIKIPGFGQTSTVELPMLPFRKETFEIPARKSPVIKIIKSLFTCIDVPIAPARPDLHQIPGTSYSLANIPIIKPYADYYPTELATSGDIYMYRGVKLWDVVLTPVSYSIETNTIQICRELELKISFDDNPTDIFEGIPLSMQVVNTDKLFHSIDNEQSITKIAVNPYPGSLFTTQDLLIITTPDLEEVTNTFAEWKRKDGYKCTIFSNENWTTTGLKQDIITFAQNHPYFVALVLVGDIDTIPSYLISQRNGDFYSDLYYACLDNIDGEDEDLYPDIQYGRIPFSSVSDAETCINKIILYEKGASNTKHVTRDTIKHILFGSSFEATSLSNKEGSPFILTSETILNALDSIGYGFTRVYQCTSGVSPKYLYNDIPLPTDLQFPNFLWNGTCYDALNVINNGTGCIFYNGHGTYEGWVQPRWHLEELSLLTNKYWFPPMFNIACSLGVMKEDNFTKYILRSPHGCSGVLSATADSYIFVNATFCQSLAQELFPTTKILSNWSIPTNNWSTIGESILNSLKYSHNIHNGPMSEFHYKIYHWFGDPTMRMFTDLPTIINNVGISFGSSQIHVNVPDQDIKLTAVYRDGDVKTTYSGYVNFPTAGCESITITGVNKVARTIYTNHGEDPEKSLLFSYLQSAIRIGNNLIINYNIPSVFAGGSFNPTTNKNGYVIVSKIDGTQVGSYSCPVSSNQITIDMSGYLDGNYIVSLVYNGTSCGSTRIRYTN